MIPTTNKILAAVFWGLVFALAYAQSPLYTSNQNQYFLHGLAQAGYGELKEDWLANTADPTPVFSQMVWLVYRSLRWEGFYFIIYALLMGVYLFSLWGIAFQLFNLRDSSAKKIVFLALLVVMHAAGLRFALSRLVGVNWTYVFEDGVADQRLLGPVLQPSAFGVFLLLSIYLFLEHRLVLAILAALFASAFHPTYLLSAAALTGSYLLSTVVEERNLRKSLLLGMLALLAAAPIVLIAFDTFASAPPARAEQARQILVDYRIPHHAVISWWFDATAAVKLVLIIAALVLVRRTRLFLVMAICAGTAVGLTLLQLAVDSTALALVFPWRISTFLLPLSSALILAFLVDRLFKLPLMSTSTAQKRIIGFNLVLVLLAVTAGVARFSLDLQRKARAPERQVQVYVADHRSAGDVYLTPIKMQDFRLATGAPAFIDFKSIPYQAEEVLEWYRRELLAERFYKTGDCAVLDEIVENYPITHVVTEVAEGEPTCPKMDLIYGDGAHQLWRVR